MRHSCSRASLAGEQFEQGPFLWRLALRLGRSRCMDASKRLSLCIAAASLSNADR